MKVIIENIQYFVDKDKQVTVCKGDIRLVMSIDITKFGAFSNIVRVVYKRLKEITVKPHRIYFDTIDIGTITSKCKCYKDDKFNEVIGKRVAESKLKIKAFRIADSVLKAILEDFTKNKNNVVKEYNRINYIRTKEESHLLGLSK